MITAPELLDLLRRIEQVLLQLVRDLEADRIPVDELIPTFVAVTALQEQCIAMQRKLERNHPGVRERTRRADASADALHDGLLSRIPDFTRRGGGLGA